MCFNVFRLRLLMEELQMEQRAQTRRNDSKKQSLLVEMERLQRDIDLAKQSTDLHHLTVETLRKEVIGDSNHILVVTKRELYYISQIIMLVFVQCVILLILGSCIRSGNNREEKTSRTLSNRNERS